MLSVDHLADFGLGGLDLGNFGGDDDLFALRGDFQDGVNRGGLADSEDEALVDKGGEAGEGDGQFVLAGRQVGNGVEAGVVGGGVILGVGGGFAQGEGSALDGGAAFVTDGAVQLSAGNLREGGTGGG